MKKWIVILIISIIAVVIAVLGVVIIISNSHNTLSFIPQNNVSVNRNNYDYNSFDYQNGRFAYLDYRFLKKELILVDTEGNHKYVSGIDEEFSIAENKIIFIKNPNFGNNYKLMSKNIDTGKTELLSDWVLNFVIYDNNIIYEQNITSENFDGLYNSNSLNICDLNGEDRRILCKDIDNYCVNGDSLYIVTDDDNPRLISISLKDFSHEDIMPIDYGFVPFMMSSGDRLLFYVDNGFELLNLQTKEFKNLGLDFTAKKIDFICDENGIYLTLQNVKYNGSLVSDVESEDNGLWKINLETFEKEKILSDVFWDLYLAGNGQLFGTLDGVPYLIDTETKQIQKIID